MKRFGHSPSRERNVAGDFGMKGFAYPKVPERTKNLPQITAAGHFVLGDVHSAPDE
ncbi:hypothetical protein [Paenibacillus sp. 1011MAR3C5]|uniref:hypothetical protein n=1 Tax=Paenibacillus sp. 1011MAR3C5 TaxID=1675787 RepID=UPI0016039AFD|nr:hypothetical protein [Paenibacillus sp. 1011MAR3C5]